VAGLSATEVADVYRRYGFVLGRRARLFLRDEALAQDAVQELLATLLRRGEGVKDAGSPYRWMCRALDRVCLDLLRRTKRTREALPLEEADTVGPAPGIDAVARRAVLESLERLDEREQAIAIAVFVDGVTQGEVASELGCSRVTVNKHVQRIRASLASSLDGGAAAASEGAREVTS
jgi:RNA polymerase sigma-70 factor (ECF subfamily)